MVTFVTEHDRILLCVISFDPFIKFITAVIWSIIFLTYVLSLRVVEHNILRGVVSYMAGTACGDIMSFLYQCYSMLRFTMCL